MPASRDLADIARRLQADAEFIQHYIEEHKPANAGPDPDFHGGSEIRLPPDLEYKRQNLFDAIEEITFLLRGPVGHVLYKSNPATFSISFVIQAIEKFEIARKLGLDETVSFSELAERCKMDTQDLEHLLGAAIAHRIFEYAGESSVRHNAASTAIARSEDLRHWIQLVREDLLPAHTGLIDALAKYPGTNKANESGWSVSHNTDLAIFERAAKDDELATRFAGSMRLLAVGSVTEHPRVAAALGLEKMEGTIVDVGGSTGDLMIEILRTAPLVKGVVQDLPNVIERAKAPPDLLERLTFQPSDYFQEQQEKDADVYLFRKIFHDWPDARCVDIIKQTIPALKVGARVLINEICLSGPGTISLRQEQEQRGWDLLMKALTYGFERSKEEWISLFTNIDRRFEFRGIQEVTGATSQIIEFTWGLDI